MQFKDFEIIHYGDETFEIDFNKAIEKFEHSFFYTNEGINYFKSYCIFKKDLTFIVKKNDEYLALCLLFLNALREQLSFSLNGEYLPSPLCKNEKIEKVVFEYIEKLALECDVKQIKFYNDPLLDNKKRTKYNILKKYDYFETNNLNLYIDLSFDIDFLWSNLSKSYKSLINKYLKNSNNELCFMNYENSSWEIYEEFYNLHCFIAKENSRNFELFKEQFNLLKNNLATLIYIKNDEEFLSFALFFHHQKSVIYATSVSKNNSQPYSHVILWKANEYFKNLEYEDILYGSPSGLSEFSGIDDCSSKKQLDISFFKRQMGAQIINVNRGIRFLDNKVFKRFILDFADLINETK